jgi:DNA invertase Pin-like site-specific DNA recombinase
VGRSGTMSTPTVDAERICLHYMRRSSRKQEESLTAQLDWSMRKAKSQGIPSSASQELLQDAQARGIHRAGDIYWDDTTGANLDRPGLTALLERVERDDRVTDVLCWSRDRLSRSERAYSAIENEDRILAAGKTLHFHDEQPIAPKVHVGSRTHDDLKKFIDYTQAGEYLFKLAEATSRGLSGNARKGFWNGGAPPYAFMRASYRLGDAEPRLLDADLTRRGEGVHTLVIPGTDPASLKRLAIVILIHDLYFKGFGGLKAIANHLNAKGVPSPSAGCTRLRRLVSGKWTISNVRAVLEQVAYIGKYAWGRRKVGSKYRSDSDSPDGFRQTLVSERYADDTPKIHVVRDPEQWQLVDPAFPYEPIIPPEVFFANLRRLAERGEQGGQRGVRRRRDVAKYPLDVICGDCFMPMSGCPYGPKLVFKCSTYLNSGNTECAHNWVEVDVVVPFALEAIKQIVGDGDNRDRLRKVIEERYAKRSRGAEGKPAEPSALRNRLDRLVGSKKLVRRDMWCDDEDLASEARERMHELKAEIRATEQELCLLKQRAEAIPEASLEEDVDSTLALLDDLHLLLDRVPKDRLSEVFQALGVSVLVDFERRKVGRRNIIPVRATVRMGGEGAPSRMTVRRDAIPGPTPTHVDPTPGQKTLCGKDGRGERI